MRRLQAVESVQVLLLDSPSRKNPGIVGQVWLRVLLARLEERVLGAPSITRRE